MTASDYDLACAAADDDEVPPIPGLIYRENFHTEDYDFFTGEAYQDEMLREIDSAAWSSELKRRVQHYGYRYDYKSRSVTPDAYIGPLPPWAAKTASALRNYGMMPRVPDQLIVNEYEPGQGIAEHIDCEPCFDSTIAIISLGSRCVMTFAHRDRQERHELVVEPRSLIVLRDEARYQWRHGIPARKSDEIGGQRRRRGRRISLTFRNVLLSEPPNDVPTGA